MTDEVEEEPDLVEDAVTKKELIIARNAQDVQKMRLDKLMENPVSLPVILFGIVYGDRSWLCTRFYEARP